MPRSFTPSKHPGTLHQYTSRLVAFEFGSDNTTNDTNILIWIGGLGDGLLTVPYTHTLAQALPSNWCMVQPILSSSYGGWGTSSLLRDGKELGICVQYFKQLRPEAKVVLMGHSTGSQDCMEYTTGPDAADRPKVQGIILQAGISDREGLVEGMQDGQYEESCKVAHQWVGEGRGNDVLPLSVTGTLFETPSSAKRWLSLASPNKDGPDDYFSSDLPDSKLRQTFGRIPRETPLLILLGGSDMFMPSHVDRKALAERWSAAAKEGGGAVDEEDGGVIPGATHRLDDVPEHVVQDLVGRVCRFLGKIDQGAFSGGAHL